MQANALKIAAYSVALLATALVATVGHPAKLTNVLRALVAMVARADTELQAHREKVCPVNVFQAGWATHASPISTNARVLRASMEAVVQTRPPIHLLQSVLSRAHAHHHTVATRAARSSISAMWQTKTAPVRRFVRMEASASTLRLRTNAYVQTALWETPAKPTSATASRVPMEVLARE